MTLQPVDVEPGVVEQTPSRLPLARSLRSALTAPARPHGKAAIDRLQNSAAEHGHDGESIQRHYERRILDGAIWHVLAT